MKTTIIELLNKLSKGEIPKKIKLDNDVYKYDEAQEDYYNDDIGIVNWLFDDYIIGVKQLDYEVEIIEETEEIDIDSIEEVNVTDRGMDTDDCILYYEDKMNELIKAVKQINNKLKEPNCKVGGTE